MTIEDKLKDLPDSPGVYIMRNADGEVIYVGKAVVLKNRVRQYFQHTEKQRKVQAMVDRIADFEYIITPGEKDALALENNLIKKYKPYYNILLKDDKTSPYIRIDTKSDYPTITVTRKVKRDGASYYGPFVAVSTREIINIIKAAFKVRTCGKNFTKTTRECLDYHLGLCSAPCAGRITVEEYAESVKRLGAFLSGRDDGIERLITQKMNEAAENELFEAAINYREQLKTLKTFSDRVVTELPVGFDMDCFAFVTNGLYGAVGVQIIRGGKIMGMRKYTIDNTVVFDEENIANFLAQYYSRDGLVPREIALSQRIETAALSEYFRTSLSANPEITFPQKGIKAKLLENAKANVRDYIAKSIDREERKKQMTVTACQRLANLLGVEKIWRMECYDISNIQGVDKVASGVCFKNGVKSAKDYRRYRIRTVEGANDFASMEETLTRRLIHYKNGDPGFDEYPDLIVIDGGKGQLKSAMEAAARTGVPVTMVGLAKRDEEVYTPFSDEPLRLMKDDIALMLLQRIRDEAHRFAITYHRTLRQKRYESELKDVPYVGATTVKKVLAALPHREIMNATASDLAAKAGISMKAAQSIYEYYHGPREENRADDMTEGVDAPIENSDGGDADGIELIDLT